MSINKNNKRAIHEEEDDEEELFQPIIPDSLKSRFAPAIMAKLVSRQKERAPGPNEFQVLGIFDHYEVSREVDGKKTNVEMSVVPKRSMQERIFMKDGKEEKKKLPERLVMRVRYISGTEVDEKVVNMEDGNTRVFAAVGFQPDAAKWFEDLHNKKVTYSGKFPIAEIMNDEGHLIQARWVTLNKHQMYKMKVGDTGPMIENDKGELPNVFRRKTEEGIPLISSHVPVKFNKCEVSQFICTRKADDGHIEPVVYTTFACKGGATLSREHDPRKPLSERYHDQEDKDQHNMIPIADYKKGHPKSYNGYFYMKAPAYQSPVPSKRGVTVQVAQVDDLNDFIYVTKDGESFPRVTMRGAVVQWEGDPDDPKRETYSVNLSSRGDQWRALGITDPEHFARIMLANPVWVHCETSLYERKTLNAEANQPLIKGPTAEELAKDETLAWMSGYYTWGIEKAVFDMMRYLPVMGLKVSREWVDKEFSRYIGTQGVGEDKRPALHMTPPDPTKQNPLHEGSYSVISLGNGKQQNPNDKKSPPRCHGYAGDVYEMLEGRDFYVIVSHTITDDERKQYCGRRKNPANVEEWIETLKTTGDGIFYWIYALDPKASAYVPTKRKKVVPEPVPVEEEEDQGEVEPMDELPDEELAHVEPEPEPESEPEEEEEVVEEEEEEEEEVVVQEEEEEVEEEEEEEMEIEEESEPTPPPSPPKKKKAAPKKVAKSVRKKK